MRKERQSMKSAKPKIGLYKANKVPRSLGVIRFGKSRPDKTKYILQDIEYDDKAEKDLYRIGMELLAKDKEAVINYVIVTALKHTAKSCKK